MFLMTKDILYSIAETLTGKLIKAIDAHKECAYICPGCKQQFVFRKGLRKRPYFAHKIINSSCTPETALHHSFKTLLYEKIKRHLDLNLPLEIHWNCSNCTKGEHTGNLLKKAVRVKLEHDLGTCKPDIVLLDKDDRTIAVVEVVVTHPPEQKILAYYKQNEIAVVVYCLKSDEDIQRLDSSTLEPDELNLCTSPKCLKCGKYMWEKHLLIADAKCWNCNSLMRVATFHSEFAGISDFSSSDIQVANQHGCLLKYQYSNIRREKYIANTCKKCDRFIGNHYLFRDYLCSEDYSGEQIELGYYCPQCE